MTKAISQEEEVKSVSQKLPLDESRSMDVSTTRTRKSCPKSAKPIKTSSSAKPSAEILKDNPVTKFTVFEDNVTSGQGKSQKVKETKSRSSKINDKTKPQGKTQGKTQSKRTQKVLFSTV